jgi:hypothetical protein
MVAAGVAESSTVFSGFDAQPAIINDNPTIKKVVFKAFFMFTIPLN